jgi:hypothetical protein
VCAARPIVVLAGINTFLKSPYVENICEIGRYDVAVVGRIGIGGWIGNHAGVRVAEEIDTTVITMFGVEELGVQRAMEIALEINTRRHGHPGDAGRERSFGQPAEQGGARSRGGRAGARRAMIVKARRLSSRRSARSRASWRPRR